MPDLSILQRAVADVSRQIRVRRAEFYGLRGLFGGAVVALLPLVLRASLGWRGFLGAGVCLARGALARGGGRRRPEAAARGRGGALGRSRLRAPGSRRHGPRVGGPPGPDPTRRRP